MNQNQSSQNKLERIDRITLPLAALEQQKQRLETEGEVAPPECVVSRYLFVGYDDEPKKK